MRRYGRTKSVKERTPHEMIQRLTEHVRQYMARRFDRATIKRISFAISLVSCLSAGLILLYLLFATTFHDNLGLSYRDCNTIAALLAVAMYAPNAALGYVADAHGPPLLLVVLILFFCPLYLVLAKLVHRMQLGEEPHVFWLGICFAFIGLATLALYFGLLLTCAKIYPNSKGMAISLPVTCFGLSLLLGLQMLKQDYFRLHYGGLDLAKVFGFFAWLYLVMGALNFIACSIVMAEQLVIFDEIMVSHSPSPVTTRDASPEPSQTIVVCDSEPLAASEELPLLPQRLAARLIEPKHHRERFVAFLNDRSMWLMMVVLILLIGPLELFQNNLGLIVKYLGANLPDQVSVMALASTLSRLLMGASSDWLSSDNRRFPICRVWLVAASLVVACIGQVGVVTWPGEFSPVSFVNGVGYGSVFTMFPTLACEIWGVDFFGTSWGTFMLAPALGLMVYSLAYGREMDLGLGFSRYFAFTLTSLLLSAVLLILTWKFMWKPRGFALF